MREIEVRAYNKITNSMVYPDCYFTSVDILKSYNDAMLYIGMRDIHKTKIYEGDIVKWSSDHKTKIMSDEQIKIKSFEIGEVVYRTDILQYDVLVYKQSEAKYGVGLPYHRTLQYYNWEVIGNIYEKPLIKLE